MADPPKTGRLPSASGVKMEINRSAISLATSKRVHWLPEPVGHSTVKSSP